MSELHSEKFQSRTRTGRILALGVSVSSLALSLSYPAQAQQTVPGQDPNCPIVDGVAICEGDLDDGVSSQPGDPDFDRLIVQNADAPIAPNGIFGIGVSRNAGDLDIEVANDIVINTFDDPAVPEPAQGIILLTGTGNINLLSGATVTTDGNGQAASAVELAVTAGDGDLNLTNNGDVSVTTSAQFSNALLVRQLGGTGDISILNNGALSAISTSTGERDFPLAGILATSQFGGGAIAITNNGQITVTASADNTDSDFNGIASGIVTNAFGAVSDTDITNTGDITLVGSEVFGITAATFNTVGTGTSTIDIINSGAISGTEIGGRGILGQGFGNAVDINVFNEGAISLAGDFNFGIFLTGSAFNSADPAATAFNLSVRNEGAINLTGDVENAIFVQNQGASGDLSVINTGNITATGDGLRGIGLSSFGGIADGDYSYELDNSGDITLSGATLRGITVFGTFDDEVSAVLLNSGNIDISGSTSASSVGIQVRFDADSAIDTQATGTESLAGISLVNTGAISLGAGTGIDILGADLLSMANSGDITGTASGSIGVSITGFDTADFSNDEAAITADAFGLRLTANDGGTATFFNDGRLEAAAATGSGVAVANGALSVTNEGAILGGDTGISATGSSELSLVINRGSITGTAGEAIIGDAVVNVRNFGTILGATEAISSTGGTVSVANNGSIDATTGVGLLAQDRVEFANAGTLTAAGGVAIQVTGTGGGNSSIVNTGDITGDIILSDGNDEFIASAEEGVLNGDIDMGAGDDRVFFDNGAVSGMISLGDGNDTISIDLDDDVFIDGGADEDTSVTSLQAGSDIEFNLGAFNFTNVETFEQIGEGTLRIVGDGSDFENYLLRGGQVFVNGNVSATDFAALAGTTIGGTGTIGNLTVTGGTLAPGNSIGTLTTGDLSFDAASSFNVELDDMGNTDLVIANGTVTLGGATLNVIETGAFAGTDPFNYIIISNDAADAVNGTFGTINNQFAFLTPTVSYTAGDGNDVGLRLTSNNAPPPPAPPSPPTPPPVPLFPTAANTFNQMQAAMALDDLDQTAGTDSAAAYMQILFTTGDQARTAFDTSSGEIYASLLSDMAESGIDRSRSLLARSHLGSGEGWGIWGGFSAHDGELDGDGNAADVDRNGIGGEIGIDYRGSDNDWAAGLVIGYQNGEAQVDARSSTADYDGWNLGAYARYGDNNAGLTLGAAFDYAELDGSVNRQISIATATRNAASGVDLEATSFAAEARYGVPVGGEGWAFGPLVSFNYADAELGRFSELGAGALNLSGNGDDFDLSRYGAGAFANWRGAWGSFDISAQYVDGSADAASARLSLDGSPTAFSVLSSIIDGSAVLIGMSGGYDLGGGWTIGADGRATFASDRDGVEGTVYIGWQF